MKRDYFACYLCDDPTKTLCVHHRSYDNEAEGAWDYEEDRLLTVCKDCHDWLHGLDQMAHHRVEKLISYLLYLGRVTCDLEKMQAQSPLPFGVHRVPDPERNGPVLSSELVRLRRLSKRSLKHWTREMKHAENELRSGDERNARDSVVWLKGYLKALDDLDQPNSEIRHGGPETPELKPQRNPPLPASNG